MRTDNAGKWTKALLACVLGFALLLGNFALPAKPVQAAAVSPLLGEIKLMPYAAAPKSWIYCAGQLLPINQNQALFSLIGNSFGGDGKTTFALPDLRASESLSGTGYYLAMSGEFPSAGSVASYATLGEVRLFPYAFTPGGWASADNQALGIAQNQALFSLLGNSYGGNGTTTFALPKLDPIQPGIRYYMATQGYFPGNNAVATGQEYLGELIAFPSKINFSSSVKADGNLQAINKNQALFSLIGTKFGGNGTTQFAMPNLSANTQVAYYVAMAGVFPVIQSGSLPTAKADTYTAYKNNILGVPKSGVLLNDSNALTAMLVDPPQHGTITLLADGSFTYTPNTNFVGIDSFTYIASNNVQSSQKQTVSITIVDTGPRITGVTDGGSYKNNVTITFVNGTAKLDGKTFASGSTVSAAGAHTLVVTPPAGPSVTINFSIDRTPPVVAGVSDGETYSTARTIGFNEGTALLDGIPIANGASISSEGLHTLIVTDSAGNSVLVRFTIQIPKNLKVTINGGTDVDSRAQTVQDFTSDGRSIAKIYFQNVPLAQALASVQAPGYIAIAANNNDPVTQVELPANVLLDLATRLPDAVIEIKANGAGASYRLPIRVFKGAQKDTTVTVTIAKAPAQAAESVRAAAAKLKVNLLLESPVDFSLRINGSDLADLGGIYVDRTFTLPYGAGSNANIVTGVWVDTDGSLHFVPSVLSDAGGGKLVTIRAPHNSLYTVVENGRSFSDLQGHWSKADVELLASKLIVDGVTDTLYLPNMNVTRAQFAALLVRSLGLRETLQEPIFNDVATSDWFAKAVGTAQKAGLIGGYEDGTFRPNEPITREQMVVMIARALAAGGKPGAGSMSLLTKFADRWEIGEWAKDAAALALGSGIVQGKTDTSFAPKANATRAESAVMLKRMLQVLGFIN